MSSTNRTTPKGGKGAKPDKTHKNESGKGGGDKQHNKDTNEDVSVKVKQVMETTEKSEEVVCYALHECDYDVNLAINMILEELNTVEWETHVKKKKNRQTSVSKQEKGDEIGGAGDDWNDTPPQSGGGGGGSGGDKERGRNKSRGGPDRMHGRNNDSRGWRGRERHENERNLEEGGGGRHEYGGGRGERRGRGGGGPGGRGGGGGRGRGGGRAGGRYPPRGNRGGGGGSGSNYNRQPIDTWDNSNTWDNSTVAVTNHNTEVDTWGDDFPGTDEWSAEEYSGSIIETKVFTPSVQPTLETLEPTSLSQPPSLDQQLVSGVPGVQQPLPPTAQQSIGQTIQQQMAAAAAAAAAQQQSSVSAVQMQSISPVPPMVGTLTAAQTQYFSQLSQQNSDNLNKQYGTATAQAYQPSYDKSGGQAVYNSTNTAQTYATTQYGSPPGNAYSNTAYQSVNTGYGTTQDQSQQQPQQLQQPTRPKTQRARVPPPSKIPASAVEMPGDVNSSIGYLDVQFGAMDLIDNGTFVETNTNVQSSEMKYGGSGGTVTAASTPLEVATGGSSPAANVVNVRSTQEINSASQLDYSKSTTGSTQQSSISSALTQSLQNTETIPQGNDHLSSNTYNNTVTGRSVSQSGNSSGAVSTTTSPSSGGVPATALDMNKQDTHSYSQSSTYPGYQSKNNAYNTSPYSATQTTAASSYVGMTNQSTNYVNNQTAAYNTASATNTYPNNYSSAATYQANNATGAFPSISQASSYGPATNQTYPPNTSQSVYGTNTGLNSNSNYGTTPTSQYNNYSTTTNSHKMGKESGYDSNSSTVSSSQTTATSNVTSTSASISLSQTTIPSNSKTTATLAAKNSSSVVSNIPPGVAPVMSTPYIMGQVPYFQQTVYSYEDMQMLQQRLPHMTTPYFDVSYQTPTTLAPVRDATLANVGYSMSSDGRFTRGDNNTSPVPSTLSQQTSTLTQGHQAQPILAGTGPPYFFAATAFNTIPNYAQFGAMYTQLPAATNAHGSTNSNQYPKPATYGSGYGSYDTLNQTQDYTKGGYVSNAQSQKGGAGGNASSGGSAGNDLAAMYGKSHATLGKVNSYEKQGFHSGTPPPFTGALHGSQNAGLAPSGTGYAQQVYIPTMAPHQQHHSTAMMHQPLHQIDVRHQGRRTESGNSNAQRSQSSNQAKAGAKQPYQGSYWNQN